MRLLLDLFWTYFKLGLFTFGGGYAMIANIREIVVEKKGWLDEDELLRIIAIAESTPGPIAINMATYVGYKRRGVLGSALATLGVVLPSLIIIFVISLFLDAFMANVWVQYAFVGIKAAVAFLILKAGLGMLQKLPKKPAGIYAALVAAMLGGRIVWGIARVIMSGVSGAAFTWAAFMAGAFTNAVPGMILHIVLIPVIVMALQKALPSMKN